MKKITASNGKQWNSGISDDVAAEICEDIESILFNAGYRVTRQLTARELEVTITSKEDPAYMPKIKLELRRSINNIYCVPTLTFPDLTLTVNDYVDSIEYWLAKWARLGKYITQLSEYSYSLTD